MRILCVVVVLWGCGAAPQPEPAPRPAATPPAPKALEAEGDDFDRAAVGALPPGWQIEQPAPAGIAFEVAKHDAGLALAVIGDPAAASVNRRRTATIKRALDVARYRGKRVLLTARGRCDPGMWSSFALVGADVARPVPREMTDRARSDQLAGPAWTTYRAVIDVAGDATAFELVVSATGAPTCQIDDLAARILGPAGTGDEAPRPLEGRGLDNVVAFARLYGIVRYFHPSDEAATLDDDAWNRFVVRGVRTVERAPDAAALATALQQLFAPIAPGVAIAREGAVPAVAAVHGIHWNHVGLGITKESAYHSVRGTGDAKGSITITTQIDPARVRGKELVVKLRARGTVAADGDAGLWIAEARTDKRTGFYTEPEAQPAVGAAWSEIVVKGTISEDVAQLSLGVQVFGGAEVWLERPVATVDGKPLELPAWGPAGTRLAPAWRDDGAGYALAVGGKDCERGRACLGIRPAEDTADRRPWSGALGGGVAATVPLELAVAATGKTEPAATAKLPSDPEVFLASDRPTRLAGVIIAWNIFEHFYPYFDVRGTDWKPVLPRALGEAARDDGLRSFHATLRRLVHDLHDGHGYVMHASEGTSRTTPWRWELVEGKLVITEVAGACKCDLAPGDVVTAIDGVPVDQAIAARGALTSAASEQDRTTKVLNTLRGGPEDGRRTLAVSRKGATIAIDAALVDFDAAPEEKRPATGSEVAPGIRYVDIGKLTEAQWTTLLPELAAAKGVIIDVRGYPSLNLSMPLANATRAPLRSAQWHIPTPARPDREGMTFQESGWPVAPATPFLPNVVFLTDGRAISAAETFMGIVEAFKLGPIVGATTAGTNGNINPFVLPGGYRVWWTGMRVLKHDGTRHHGVGIAPTVPAARTIAGVAAGRDEVLEKGIAVAQQRAKRK